MTDRDNLTPEQRRHRHRLAATEAARAAKRARSALPRDRPEVFVVRDGQRFRWEIRRYGSVVVVSGTELFGSMTEALHSGETAMSAMSAMVMPVR